VLAALAMLAPKWALRVAPGGSAPPIPSAARRVAAVVRPGRESRRLNRTGKLPRRGTECQFYFARRDISNGEKKCLFKRGATCLLPAASDLHALTPLPRTRARKLKFPDWLATRLPRWNISMVRVVMRVSTCSRSNACGTERKPSTSTWLIDRP
jgi:hypothetical protein